MSFTLQNDTEITIRTSAIIACHSMDIKGANCETTQIFVEGMKSPLIIKSNYEDTKSWIERACE